MALGALLILAALTLAGYNIYKDKTAGEKAENVTKYLYTQIELPLNEQMPLYVSYPEMEMPAKLAEDEWYVGILEIPEIGIVLPVMAEPWNETKLEKAPGVYEGSVYKNNMIVAAHNYRTHFGKLKNLKAGSAVYFTDMNGNRFEYATCWSEVIEQTDIDTMTEDGDWDLTLFTCTYGGKKRLAVRCVRQDF